MKKTIFLIGLLFLFSNCTKEVGKKPYDFIMKFDSGDYLSLEVAIYEKAKEYENQNVQYNINTQTNTSAIYIEDITKGPHQIDMVLYKTDNKRLVGVDNLQNTLIANASFAGGQHINVYGTMELEGSYSKFCRRFRVEEGTFSFDWTNAADYGYSNQTLTGTWTLKQN